MRIRIHRGTKEIGGTCVEIEAHDKRIVLDIGLPLDVDEPEDVPLYPIQGFNAGDSSLLGVVISHPHRDHYGLAQRLPPETMFLIGHAAERILAAADLFTDAGLRLQNVIHLRDRTPITLGPFTLTPYLVDHSAYDAYALLVETEGQRLFYSGDFRSHGRKGKLFDRLLSDPPPKIDVLLMEGTTVGRADSDQDFPSESDLELRLVDLFRKAKGMPLVCCSGQNVDRLVTIFRACKRTGRTFIVDMYTAHILAATENRNVPQKDWPDVRIFLPSSQKRQIINKGAFEVAKEYRPYRIFPEQLAAAAPTSVMLFRPSMIRDVDKADCLAGALLVYSMWPGYLKDQSARRLLDWLAVRAIPLEECHTSGHASLHDLIRLCDACAPLAVVPIHTDRADLFADHFRRVMRLNDGVWFDIDRLKERS